MINFSILFMIVLGWGTIIYLIVAGIVKKTEWGRERAEEKRIENERRLAARRAAEKLNENERHRAQPNDDKRRQLHPETKKRLKRPLACAIGGILLVLAIIEAMADTHNDNTEWKRTSEEIIPVGKDIVVPGPDWMAVIMLLAASGVAFKLSVTDD